MIRRSHKGRDKDTGPGIITAGTDTLTFTVMVDDLNPSLVLGETVYIWADTQHKGINDRAPNTESGDGCAKPEVESEVLALTLSPQKTIFATSGTFNGDLVSAATNLGLSPSGGLEAGDMICQKLADDSVLSGTYKAWLADGTGSPDTRFTKATVPYVRTDGVKVADDYADLINCSNPSCLQAPINVDELGVTTSSARTWSNAGSFGTLLTDADNTPSSVG